MKKISIIFLITILLSQPLVYAEVICKNCFVGECRCTITDCDSGIVDIFSSATCTMMPDYEFVFSNGYLKWSPESARSYYLKALCEDGKTQSDCTLITVRMAEETTTTTKPTTTLPTTTTKPTPTSEGGGVDYTLIILVVILILVILFLSYFFFLKKGGKKKSYEELYKKWGK